jgi:hypothetical protein
MKLVPNWKTAHKLWSVRLAVCIPVIVALGDLLPSVKELVKPWVFVGLSCAVIIARVIQQEDAK